MILFYMLILHQMTSLWNWLVADYTLTKKLRKYSAKHVKISEADMGRTKKLVGNYIEDEIMWYCRPNSKLPIQNLQYTGSVYERLKTEAADEVDVMVVLKTTKPWFWGDPEVIVEETDKPGYARLKTSMADSKLRKYVNSEGYIIPERLRNGLFYSLVDQALRDFRSRSPDSDVTLVLRYHGPAVQLDIFQNGTGKKLLSVDLVPCLESNSGDYFVAKRYAGSDLLWRQSFSLKEKELLRHMDKDDHGYRHELLRIVKTIMKRERTSLGRLHSYHLKTAFMHYIYKTNNWAGGNSLGKHFVGFFAELQAFLERGNLPHYWLPDVNLLDDIDKGVVEQMAYRLKRILNSEAVRNDILGERGNEQLRRGIAERDTNRPVCLVLLDCLVCVLCCWFVYSVFCELTKSD